MGKISPLVQEMKKNFLELRAKRYTIPEIAKMYSIDWSTVYNHLQNIADENGVSRESLLDIPHQAHTTSSTVKRQKIKVNIDEISVLFSNVIDGCDNLISAIDKVLQDE